jgi:hypothetical protein
MLLRRVTPTTLTGTKGRRFSVAPTRCRYQAAAMSCLIGLISTSTAGKALFFRTTQRAAAQRHASQAKAQIMDTISS